MATYTIVQDRPYGPKNNSVCYKLNKGLKNYKWKQFKSIFQ